MHATGYHQLNDRDIHDHDKSAQHSNNTYRYLMNVMYDSRASLPSGHTGATSAHKCSMIISKPTKSAKQSHGAESSESHKTSTKDRRRKEEATGGLAATASLHKQT